MFGDQNAWTGRFVSLGSDGAPMQLEAGRGRVLWQVLREGLLTALTGTILGSAGAWFVVRALRAGEAKNRGSWNQVTSWLRQIEQLQRAAQGAKPLRNRLCLGLAAGTKRF